MENESMSELVKSAEIHVQDLLQSKLQTEFQYHNLAHTREVVSACQEIAGRAELDNDAMEILLLAAWFHDTGYTEKPVDHEACSAEIAGRWLGKSGFPQTKTKEVMELIRSTRRDAAKPTFLSKILHDADHVHMGKKRFFQRGELLRTEQEEVNEMKYSDLEWEQIQYEFLLNTDFLTVQAQNLFGDRKARNVVKQREVVDKTRRETTRTKTGKDIGRGIDTLYRTNYSNHINFSSIADGKANMMISINTILISVIVTLSGASLSLDSFAIERFRYIVPIMILLVGSTISVVFAVLSARPKVTTRKFADEDLKDDKVSLLFFGNFQGVPRDTFVRYLSDLKQDQQRLYDNMSVDLYNLGSVLKEKYRLLTISYNIFMTGMMLSVVAFIVIFIYTNA